MAFEDKIITGKDFLARLVTAGEHSFELEINGKVRLAFGRVTLGGFSESNALPSKMRLHESLDGLSCSFEAENVIPFGCEYLVKRQMDILAGGIGTLTDDLSAVNHGAVGNVALEDVIFPGPWTTLEYLPFGETEFRKVELAGDTAEIYGCDEAIVMLRLSDGEGVQVEYACGSDLWRHRAAKRTAGAVGHFEISGNNENIVLKRSIVTFAEDAVIEKRPWRFKSLFSWTTNAPAGAVPTVDARTLPVNANGMQTSVNAICLCSSPARKVLKDLIRKADSDIVLGNVESAVCFNSAHQDRPGKGDLEHLDIGDWVDFYLWANRQLLRQGKSFKLKAAEESLFATSVTVKNMMR